MTNQQCNALNTLLHWLDGTRVWPQTEPPSDDEAANAIDVLARASHRKMLAGYNAPCGASVIQRFRRRHLKGPE